jgi:hypothetical protein
MEAACRGAVSAGGETIGLLPGEDASEANPYVTLALPTGLGKARNRAVALAGFVLVAVGGAYGTLTEMAYALEAGRPVCCHGPWSMLPGVEAVATPRDALRFVRSRDAGGGRWTPST